MRMLCTRIGAALDEVYGPVRAGRTDRPLPTDCLQYFALLNRESTQHDPEGFVPAPTESASEGPARYRRGAIYVRCPLWCPGAAAGPTPSVMSVATMHDPPFRQAYETVSVKRLTRSTAFERREPAER